MITTSSTPARYAVCVDNREYPASLELHRVYRLVPDPEAEADGDLRVLDESGEDYLYPATYFLVLALPPDQAATLAASYAVPAT